ncbi:MAG TPA: hypothetical protein VMP08_12680, partial [Anaerolineae bacterium]|nr:hypothetical protein [Anaerolineae bacterium]
AIDLWVLTVLDYARSAPLDVVFFKQQSPISSRKVLLRLSEVISGTSACLKPDAQAVRVVDVS